MQTLLVELIEELSRAHTEATFTRGALNALARHFPISSLELTLHAAAGAPKRFTATASSEISGGARGHEYTIPLVIDGTNIGRAIIVLAPKAPSPSSALIDDIGRVLSAALRQLHALARVAKVSRRAYAQSK